jgi:hypothetical protein
VLALALGAGLTACTPPEPAADPTTETMAEPTAAMEARPVTYTATEFSYEGPDNFPGGMTEVVFVNAGKQSHSMIIAQLLDGHTVDDLMPVLGDEDAPIPDWIAFPGGFGSIEGGDGSVAVLDFEPGQYVMFSFDSAPGDDVPDVAKGMIKAFEVTAPEGAQAAIPDADITVDMVDFTFSPSGAFKAGEQVVKVQNNGKQPHEMMVGRLAEGVTAEDFLKMMMESGPPGAEGTPADGTPAAGTPAAAAPTEGAAASGTPAEGAMPEGQPFTGAGGMGPLSPGSDGYASLDLEPGRYVLICFIPDSADGQPHMTKGMIQEFEVAE